MSGILASTLITPRESPLAIASLMASGVIWGLIWRPLKFFAGEGLTGYTFSLTAYALVAAVSLPLIWHQRQRWWAERCLLLLTLFAFIWLLGGTLVTTYGVTHVLAATLIEARSRSH